MIVYINIHNCQLITHKCWLLSRFKSQQKLIQIVTFLKQNPSFLSNKKQQKIIISLQEEAIGEKEAIEIQKIEQNNPIQDSWITIENSKVREIFENQLQQILSYQKKVAAQLFIRNGYGLNLFREQIMKRGGLFKVTKQRYKIIGIEVTQATFRKIEKYLQEQCNLQIDPISTTDFIYLVSVLLNCRLFYEKKEIIAFLKFVALLYEEICNQISLFKGDIISFYKHSLQLLKVKKQKGRLAFKLDYSLKKTLNSKTPNQKGDPAQDNKEALLLQLYVKTQKYGQTKDRYQKIYGESQQFDSTKSVQSVVFRTIRKTLKQLQEYYRQNMKYLPRLVDINDNKIKRLLSTAEGSGIRAKIVAFSLELKKRFWTSPEKRKDFIQLWYGKDLNMNMLISLIKDISCFFQKQYEDYSGNYGKNWMVQSQVQSYYQ